MTEVRTERREIPRISVYRSALLSIAGQAGTQSCMVRNFTVKGAGVRLNGITLLPMEFEISFDGFHTSEACRLIWRDSDFAGFAFQAPSKSRVGQPPN